MSVRNAQPKVNYLSVNEELTLTKMVAPPQSKYRSLFIIIFCLHFGLLRGMGMTKHQWEREAIDICIENFVYFA